MMFFLGIVVVMGVIIFGSAIALSYYFGILPLNKPAEPIDRAALRVKCDHCGRIYHPDWGDYCPNCTGAD